MRAGLRVERVCWGWQRERLAAGLEVGWAVVVAEFGWGAAQTERWVRQLAQLAPPPIDIPGSTGDRWEKW